MDSGQGGGASGSGGGLPQPGQAVAHANQPCPLALDLIKDSNPDFRLSDVNAEAVVHNSLGIVPAGFEIQEDSIAGPGGPGADVKFKNAEGKVFGVEVKCVAKERDIDGQLSHAAQDQAPGGAVVIQVPAGTDVSKVLPKFWGNRKNVTANPEDPANKAKLDNYSSTTVTIVDDTGKVLVPTQPIYQPKK
ncbi:MAG: hypothetical protein ACKVOR_11175 [Flavobacteriales bacterium]